MYSSQDREERIVRVGRDERPKKEGVKRWIEKERGRADSRGSGREGRDG